LTEGALKKEITFAAVPIAPEEALTAVFEEFEALTNIHVNLQIIPWDHYRQDFANITVHRLPFDVGATGMPATSDLIAMNSLRPFTPTELRTLGGEAAFLPSRWRSGMRPGDSEVWAIPWLVDLRLFYYRRDLLAQAGVDEAAAFASAESIEQAILKIKDSGVVESPWMTTFVDPFGILHRVASWIWAYGGDLFSSNGKRVVFHEPEALEGMRAYFRLIRHIPSHLKDQDSRALLEQGKIALTIDSGWGVNDPPAPNIGCAAVPGGSYVGGSDLIIWNHTRSEDEALELTRFLAKPSTAARVFQSSAYLPVHASELEAAAQSPHPVTRSIVQAALSGRSFPCTPMIGLIEERLSQALTIIQNKLVTEPGADADQLLKQYIIPLGKRTNLTLESIP
jgi:multiple sugar transport system substrate-binding protein